MFKLGCVKRRVPSNMRKMHRFRISSACAKYHPALCSQFIHSVVFNISVRGHGRPWSDCMDVQADLGLRCPHMPEDTFSPSFLFSKFEPWMAVVQSMLVCLQTNYEWLLAKTQASLPVSAGLFRALYEFAVHTYLKVYIYGYTRNKEQKSTRLIKPF